MNTKQRKQSTTEDISSYSDQEIPSLLEDSRNRRDRYDGVESVGSTRSVTYEESNNLPGFVD
jgi:hypothetical protein